MATTPLIMILFHHLFLLVFLLPALTAAAPGGGRWDLLVPNAGVSAMHMQLLNTDRVVIFDRTNFGPSNISLPDNQCRENPKDLVLQRDCTAHSVEYDVASGSIRPLNVFTDTWCSSGATMPDGTLVQTGGFSDGEHNARVYKPCNDNSCDWRELNGLLAQPRWYATNHMLPDGRMIVIGGRGQFNYEFYPKGAGADQSFDLPFLAQTNEPSIENNLYPFVFLNVDGNLFIFANNRAILYDYVNRAVVRTYLTIPGGHPRNYPSAGSAVLLPLQLGSKSIAADVLVCGGAPNGSYVSASNGKFVGALDTCGRIRITDPNPEWEMDNMTSARTMGDMVLLPNGNVLIINGASSGANGWDLGRDPELTPLVYRPGNPIGSRFEKQRIGSRPRMYHSTAALLRDGRVLVGGSNTNAFYNFTGVRFPTDLTLEAFSPDYLNVNSSSVRPRVALPLSHSQIEYGKEIPVVFSVRGKIDDTNLITVTMVAPPFATHSFSQNQRLLVLSKSKVEYLGARIVNIYETSVTAPSSSVLAPPGYYLLFVVYREIPSEGVWVQIK